MAAPPPDPLLIADLALHSRLLLGTSGYPSPQVLYDAFAASGAQVATVAIRRINLHNPGHSFLTPAFRQQHHLLPNTAGCFTARDAVLTAHLAREALNTAWIKVEVIADDESLLPDPVELLAACTQLVKDGFVVLPYCSDDPILCRRLADAGCAAVMPLAAPIGTGLGIRNPHALESIAHSLTVPVIVDAGLGSPADAAQAMELGCAAVLLNTAVAQAEDPVRMAQAFGLAVQAGRLGYLAGRIPRVPLARPSSPLQGRISGPDPSPGDGQPRVS